MKFWSARPGSPNSSKLPPTKNHMDKGNGSTAGPRNPMGWPDLWLSSFRLVSTDLGQHLSQSSAAAQHAQHVVACTTSRTRQWRHRTISRRHVVRCDRSSSRRMRDSGIESEADTDVFHARVINAWSEDADEDFFENNSEEFLCKMFVNT